MTEALQGIGTLVVPDEFEEPLGFDVVGDTIVVAMLQRSSTTASGIEIAGQRTEKPSAVVVLGAGPHASIDHTDGFRLVERGDRLVAHRHEVTRLELADGRELHTLKPKSVIGVFDA